MEDFLSTSGVKPLMALGVLFSYVLYFWKYRDRKNRKATQQKLDSFGGFFGLVTYLYFILIMSIFAALPALAAIYYFVWEVGIDNDLGLWASITVYGLCISGYIFLDNF